MLIFCQTRKLSYHMLLCFLCVEDKAIAWIIETWWNSVLLIKIISSTRLLFNFQFSTNCRFCQMKRKLNSEEGFPIFRYFHSLFPNIPIFSIFIHQTIGYKCPFIFYFFYRYSDYFDFFTPNTISYFLSKKNNLIKKKIFGF